MAPVGENPATSPAAGELFGKEKGMGMISICDGCGKQEQAICSRGNWFKPHHWFERTPLDKNEVQQRTLTACSRDCIDSAERKRKAEDGDHKESSVVLPI